MIVLGFDISTVATGWAAIDGEKLLSSGVIAPVDELKEKYGTKKAAKEAMSNEVVRFMYIIERAAKIIEEINPDVLVVEDSFMKTNASVLRLLARLSGGVLWAWYMFKYSKRGFKKPYLVMASRARATVGCKGNAKKPEIIQFIRRKYDIVFDDDNEADAFILAQYGYRCEKQKEEQERLEGEK